ncbi:MAG: SUMF1/EgtB/PvdO family nonheme iron enzyme, partial [Candidatus Aminicenantes bacterium]|nr:SUMF1/EgtB/PvdO family nonheme iron enzyme [Candidatus Aminicenantes bacterium]NIM79284.1 SUMF1/EgtB/PvdO family nonheme iron enzyme [Candidatus Aminicenantes bacterium]NIN18570.1 SUMF1/EgtB/PvdO family nonheme iron enzyme [Candidatus Aminicenantes bacterium]NIN42467.1 SUMF1/EgtB/PvdO family nonheme iron enzyme [Candidatus Aminicenantes bacterium]NIN85225.1 SUMF1/EgtB/PvdO family nonheme iron enzyme [Candidatus Aminicenantes bacterium]
MAKIYISSTYEDLKKEREAAAKAIRRLGHTDIAMENDVAYDKRPVDKCLEDVRNCDVYVGIFAWRYGDIPEGQNKSITHLEYEEAQKAGKDCLIFLLDEEADWSVKKIDRKEKRDKIERLRSELQKRHGVSFFSNADELSGLVSPAVSRLLDAQKPSPVIQTSWKFEEDFKWLEDLIGKRFGKYVIKEKLGRGGKGVVFKVMDTLEDIPKAAKLVPPQIADSPVAFKELKREVNNASRIIHPNVVKVLGLEKQEGQYFIMMEYIEGRSLEQILADSKEEKLSETEVITLMKKLAQGLHESHKNQVIHRDIKPANIMVTPGKQLKILDFGISYQVTKSMTQLVGEDDKTGTWPYMAPEQLSTDYGRENEQVDIWGLGVTMYQLLTGQLPFKHRDQIKDRNEKPYELEGVTKKIRKIVMKCLAKDRKKRFKNMEEVLEALKNVSKKKVKVRPKVPPNWKWILAAAAIIFLVVIGIFIKDKIINKLEEVPEDVMKIQAKIGKEKVYINNSSYWEADYGDGIKMVYIPAGEFTMGSDKGDYDEYPEHKVYLDGYWMGKTEVTVGQFRKFVEENRYITEAEMDGLAYTWTSDKWEPKEGITWKNPGFIQDDNYPVVCISWNDAVEYCKWISEKKEINFKLPTEAQWEKAARGSTGIEYPWGDHEPYYKGEWYANYAAHDSWEKRGEDGFGFTAPVGSYPQGAPSYGLLDMVGNVWEWCYDRYGIYSNG